MRKRETSLKLWARVENGEITHGPGPKPYRIDGNIVSAYNEAQLNAIDVYRVVVDYDDEYDEDILLMTTPTDTVENGVPIRTMNYEFQPSPKNRMLKKLYQFYNDRDNKTNFMTPLLYVEFKEAETEASKALNDPDPQSIEYPLLAADVGVVRKQDGSVVADIKDAANLAIARMDRFWQRLANWRQERAQTEENIRSAATNIDAFRAYRSVVPKTYK